MKVLVVEQGYLETPYDEFLPVHSFKKLPLVRGTVDSLVIGPIKDSTEEIMSTLPDFLTKVSGPKVYICSDDSMDSSIAVLIEGAGGVVNSDEFFLSEESRLLKFLDNPKSSRNLKEKGIVQVLKSFTDKSSKGKELTPASSRVLLNTVEDLTLQIERLEKDRLEVSKAALRNLTNNQRQIKKSQKDNKELMENLNRLEKIVQEGGPGNGDSSGALRIFPKFRLEPRRSRNFLPVKVHGLVTNVVSFFIAFQDFCQNSKNIRTRVVFLVPPDPLVENRYQKSWYALINERNSRGGPHYNSDIVFVSYPTKHVLEKLLQEEGHKRYESTVVVDMLTGDHKHLVATNKPTLNVITGSTPVGNHGLKLKDCISCVNNVKGVLFHIPALNDFPEDPDLRIKTLREKCNSQYRTLLNRQGL